MNSITHRPTVRRVVGPTILLRSGNYFDFEAPETSAFTIDDIAHALSMICRFTGHVSRFYSVALHSVLVADHLPPNLAYAGLMHDAAEAFIGDMSKPLKQGDAFYRDVEHRVEAAIFARFGVPQPMPPEVKEMDIVMLATEQRHLMRNSDDWAYVSGRIALDIDIPDLGPGEAKALFLDAFERLRPAGVGR